MKNQLLLEGAVAGHMNHIYDNGEMTFGELKQLLQAAVDGKLRGTEKTDGQNIFLSFDVAKQKGRAIRNKTHIKAGGLSVEELDDFFSAHPNQSLRYSFVEALQVFEDAIKLLDKETQLKIFGSKEDNIYFNTEVMNPGFESEDPDDPRSKGTTNVIPYDKKTLLIHEVGHSMFDPDTALAYDDNKSLKRVEIAYTQLESALVGKSTEDASSFSLETHPRRSLEKKGMKKAAKILPDTINAINNIVEDFGLNDSSTIQDMVMVQIKPIIDNFGLTEDRNSEFILRLMGLCKSLKDPGKLMPCGTKDPRTGERLHRPPINIKDLTSGLPQELSNEIREFDKAFKYQEYTASLSNALYEFTNAILDGFESSFIEDNQKAIKDLQNQIKLSINKIKSSSNEAAKEDLIKQMKKLQDVKNVNTPSEGFVFNFNGITYKFTGWFAPSNQILGTERYGRFGPIEPSTDQQDAPEAPAEGLRIALFPGSFKPPHKGHIKAAEALGEDADIVYIFISAPELSARTMKSGKSISAEQAVHCWNIMIDKSPLKNKTRVMIGPPNTASSMMTAINFIQHEADPNNIYSAPQNSTVILGVGAKGSDASRYGPKVLAKSKEKRPDLNIEIKAVGPFFHEQEYLELLKKHPSILQMLNSGKGRSESDMAIFHASDMRDFIDLSENDPIGMEFLKDFVPRSEDVLAILGVIGINPADKQSSESDQVEEEEVDALKEILTKEANIFYENFRSQKTPKGKPDSGKFQGAMRRRLSKAHATYLDMGRKDLTKYGGGFHLDRPKNISNAFLAEDEFEEAVGMAGGTIQGAPAVIRNRQPNKTNKKENKMLNQEKKLRIKIKEGLKSFFAQKAKEHEKVIASILQEHQLRLHLRDIIFEEVLNMNDQDNFKLLSEQEDPTTDIHDNTGINTLKDLFKNTNILATLRNVYKTLTTDEDQKRSFRAHIIQWTQDTLAPVKLNDTDSLPSKVTEQRSDLTDEEQIGIDIQGVDSDKFLGGGDIKDGSEKEEKPDPEEENTMKPISGEDTTGRNKAERVYPTIEKSVIDYYAELDNAEDQEMFYDYIIANLKLYFDKWGNEMAKSVEEPTNDAYKQAKDTEQSPGLSAS